MLSKHYELRLQGHRQVSRRMEEERIRADRAEEELVEVINELARSGVALIELQETIAKVTEELTQQCSRAAMAEQQMSLLKIELTQEQVRAREVDHQLVLLSEELPLEVARADYAEERVVILARELDKQQERMDEVDHQLVLLREELTTEVARADGAEEHVVVIGQELMEQQARLEEAELQLILLQEELPLEVARAQRAEELVVVLGGELDQQEELKEQIVKMRQRSYKQRQDMAHSSAQEVAALRQEHVRLKFQGTTWEVDPGPQGPVEEAQLSGWTQDSNVQTTQQGSLQLHLAPGAVQAHLMMQIQDAMVAGCVGSDHLVALQSLGWGLQSQWGA